MPESFSFANKSRKTAQTPLFIEFFLTPFEPGEKAQVEKKRRVWCLGVFSREAPAFESPGQKGVSNYMRRGNKCGPVTTPPLEWTSFPPLIAAVLNSCKGAESPGSRRIGVIGALVYFLPSETVGARGGGGLQPDAAARPLDRTRVPRIWRGV